MRAADENLAAIFGVNVQYQIPIFQRPYVWKQERNWQPLWEDLRTAAEHAEHADRYGPASAGAAREQFLGAVVTQLMEPLPRRVQVRTMIDGQQRVTTLQVLFASAYRLAAKLGAGTACTNFENLVRNRIFGASEYPGDRFKVVPLPGDKDAFEWAVRDADDDRPAPDPKHPLVLAADFFTEQLTDWTDEVEDPADRLDMLAFAISDRVKVVSVYLDGRDDPQVIFEALNYKGVPLDAADLVKNLLFQRLVDQGDRHLSDEMHERHWKVLDTDLWRAKVTTGRIERSRLDTLLAYWLSARQGQIASVEHLYRQFKTWLADTEPAPRAADVIVDVRRWADTMDELHARPISDPTRQVIDRLEVTNSTTPWPLLLHLHSGEGIPPEQAQLGAEAIDSYLMRRGVGRLTAKDYNNVFAGVLRAVLAGDPAFAGESVVEELARQSAPTRRWPSDADFVHALLEPNLYNLVSRPRLKALLVGLDNAMTSARTEPAPLRQATEKKLTIEHVLPQKWAENWPVGDDPARIAVRQEHVHQLGNLTLTAQNGALSNGPWPVKKELLQEFSLLRLTTATILSAPEKVPPHMPDGTAWADTWDESRIQLRSMWLVSLAMRTWTRPPTGDTELDIS